MTLPASLVEIVAAIESQPIQEACPKCDGARRVRSLQWQSFVDAHGEGAVGEARAAMAAAKKKHAMSFEILWRPTADQLIEEGLTSQVANDFVAICGEAEMNECPDCNGEGTVLTDTGKALQSLKNLLAKV